MRYIFVFIMLIFSSFTIIAQDNQDQATLYLTSHYSGNGYIDIYDTQTGNITPLLSFPNQGIRCFWASDTSDYIAYGLASTQANSQTTSYVVNDLRDDTPTFTFSNLNLQSCPVWSDDGQQFAAVIDNTIVFGVLGLQELNEIMTFEQDIRQMPTGETITPAGGDLAWSRWGGSLAFTALGDVYIYQADRTIIQVTDTPDINERIISWSPDGDALVIQASATLQTEANIYLAVYDVNDQTLWRITDDLAGTNITQVMGWQANRSELIFKLESDSTVYKADIRTQSLTDIVTSDTPLNLVTLTPDGESLLYVQNQVRSEDNNAYTLDIIQHNLITGEQDIWTHTEAGYVISTVSVQLLPENDGMLLILRKENDQFTGVYYDAETQTFETVFTTDSFVSFPSNQLAPTSNMMSYRVQTNAQLYGADSDHVITVINLDTKDSTNIVTQAYNWDNPFPAPMMRWVQG